jgi:rhodanese-related sulfurtransferase
MEPLAVAAMVALNQVDGVESVSPGEDLAGRVVLDVRSTDEAAANPVDAGRRIHIPLEALAERVTELDASAEIVVCERGTRSAEAVRLLLRHGIRVRYLAGGLHWRRSMDTAGESGCAGRVAGS